MSITNAEAELLRSQGKPIFGWIEEEDGLYVGPNNFAHRLFASEWFVDFAERASSSYSMIEYARTVLRQRRRRASTAKGRLDRG